MLGAIDLSEPILVIIRYGQLIFSFVFGIGFLVGIFLFIYSFKNPMKRRTAYLLTILMPVGLIVTIHGPVFLLYYVFSQPIVPDEKLGLYIFEPFLEVAGANIYEAFKKIVFPLLVAVLFIGVAVLHHASRIPGRKRIGYGILVGIPLLLILMAAGPSILGILTS